MSGDYQEQREAFNRYLRTGEVQNALTTGDGGGVQVPEQSPGDVFEKMKGFSPLMQSVEVHKTSVGGTIPIPVIDDTANSGRQRDSETQNNNNVEPVVTGMALGSFPYSSDSIEISYTLLRDSSYDVEGKVRDMLLRRLSRKVSTDGLLADGISKAYGLVNAAEAGVESTGEVGVFDDFGDLIELIGTVDSAYADVDIARFAVSRDMFIKMLKLKQSQNKFHQTFFRDADGWKFEDYKVDVYEQMAGVGAGNVTALFGYFKAYQLRVVGNPRLRRSEANMAKNETIEVSAFWDADGDIADVNAVKKLTIKAS